MAAIAAMALPVPLATASAYTLKAEGLADQGDQNPDAETGDDGEDANPVPFPP